MSWWWPFGGNSRAKACEEIDGCEAGLEGEESEEYLESLPACIRNDKERLRRARENDQLEKDAHKLMDSQVLMLREIRKRLAEEKK